MNHTNQAIFVLWPTARPEMAVIRANGWQLNADKKAGAECFCFGINDVNHEKIMSSQLNPMLSLFFCYPNARKGVTHTATLMSLDVAEKKTIDDSDIVVLASDDFSAPLHWDTHLREQFENFSGVLNVNDGYKVGTNIIPIPVMDAATLRKLNGIIYNPVYSHMFSDQELYDIAVELNILKDLRRTNSPVFSHQHWSFGSSRVRDVVDERNTNFWQNDKAEYERRKSLPAASKLSLPNWWEKQ